MTEQQHLEVLNILVESKIQNGFIRYRRDAKSVDTRTFPMPEDSHSDLGASICERFYNCPGSVGLIKKHKLTSNSNKYALEGTVAHWIAANFLANKHGAVGSGDIVYQVYRGKLSEPIEVDDEMIEYVMVYVAHIRELINQWGEKGEIEERVSIPERIDQAEGFTLMSKLFGTTDWAAVVLFNVLLVADLKYGAGHKVSAKDNLQLKYYVLAKLLSLPADERNALSYARGYIIQPRRGGISYHDWTIQELLAWHPELIAKAKLTEKEDAPIVAGDWCQFCPANSVDPKTLEVICPAKRNQNKEMAVMAFSTLEEKTAPAKVAVGFLVEVLDKADDIRSMLKQFEDYALKFAQESKDNAAILSDAGWQLTESYGRSAWTPDASAALQAALGEAAFETSLIGITKARAAVKKAGKPINIDSLTSKPFKGYGLSKSKVIEVKATRAFDGIE